MRQNKGMVMPCSNTCNVLRDGGMSYGDHLRAALFFMKKI